MTPHVYGTPPQEQIAFAREKDVYFLKLLLNAASSRKQVDLHLFKKFNQHSRPAFRVGSHKHVLLHNPKRLARVLAILIKELTRIYGHKITSHWLSCFFAEQLDVELSQPDIDSQLDSDENIEELSRCAIRKSGLKRTKWFQTFWLW